jgi:allophanate hydrolase
MPPLFATPIDAVARAIAADRALGDPALWAERLPDEALRAEAARLSAEGPRDRTLWGVPVAVGEDILAAGAHAAGAEAEAVRRLRAAGAIVLGRTRSAGPRNIFDATRLAGGTAAGAAGAVAAGIAAVALALDRVGEARVAASFANVVALAATRGSVSARGLAEFGPTDTLAVIARSADEALAGLRALAGEDVDDPWSRAAPVPHLRRDAAPPRATVARVTTPPELAALYARAAAGLPDGEVVDIAPLLPPEGELAAARPRALAEWRHAAAALFRRCDALLLPTAWPAQRLGESDGKLTAWTALVNACDLVAYAVPAGFLPDGRPFGVSLVGPAWSEGLLAPLADAAHRALSPTAGATGRPLPPALPPDPLDATETALFCAGAHMAGLPHSRALADLGGRLLHAAATRPDYRLFALGKEAGLLRVASGGGEAIIGEVWALPTAALGRLMATLAAPLTLGTVVLHDGPCLGLLAEAEGVRGAAEITEYGGWRQFLSATG